MIFQEVGDGDRGSLGEVLWGEVAPFTSMVAMEGCTILLTILAKTVISGGMSPFVFVVYTNAIGTMLLIPFSIFYHRSDRTEHRLFTWPLILRSFFLGLIGVALSQNLAFLGLSYSSPIVVCGMGLLTPAFSFILAIILRNAKVEWRSPNFQIKMVGTLVSVMGAIVVEHYNGPFIRKSPSLYLPLHLHLLTKHHNLVFYSATDNWVIGCLLLAASFFCISISNVIQSGTAKQYPHLMKVASCYSFAGTIQSAIFCLVVERDLNAWKLRNNMELSLILAAAIFGSIVRSSVQISCARKKGPFYVPLFQPFRIFWAVFFGVGFFVNGLHYGSAIGAIISGVGYYVLTWGQTRENEKCQDSYKSSDEKVPLLEEDSEV